MGYRPIENYGVIGNLHTAALVGVDGSIDWLCYPHFDSPSVFAALLDDARGGQFRIAPRLEGTTCKQFYWPDTNVLVTRFLAPAGVAEIVDFMPVGTGPERRHDLLRMVRGIRGRMPMTLLCRPAFDYARRRHRLRIAPEGARFELDSGGLGLSATVPLAADADAAVADFELDSGSCAVFLLHELGPSGPRSLGADRATEEFNATVRFWRDWLAQTTYSGRWREMVHRSALTLKLLTFAPTGAIVAAPTTSLPEHVGGERNWDYRFTWIRDAAFTLYGLLRIGFVSEAEQFMGWLAGRIRALDADHPLQNLYGIDGRSDIHEEILPHLAGYRDSRPVRVGNGAVHQLQLDIYGELLDSVYLYNKHGSPISYDLWQALRGLVDYVAANWQREDDGIWEVRSGRRHFVYSKLMCWVAMDRGIRLARKRSFPAPIESWRATRDQIYEEIMARGFSLPRGAFVQHYGSDALDAANLIMPLVFFLSPTDPRMLSTLDAINRPPKEGGLVSNSLVHRYHPHETGDGLSGQEGSFNMCTFWLVEALTRAGRLEEARLVFEQMLGYANHLGLYAEETGPTGEALGNFPQAFTHIALISAAFNLDRRLS